MVTATSSRAVAERQPSARREPERRTRLVVVDPGHLSSTARRRRARILAVLAAALVLGTLLAIAAAQAVVASQQMRIDGLQQSLATATASNENLQLEHADLSSPARVLVIAERHLGMIVPKSVTYLPAVDPGPPAFPTGSVSR
jgi:cell division protein FtsL